MSGYSSRAAGFWKTLGLRSSPVWSDAIKSRAGSCRRTWPPMAPMMSSAGLAELVSPSFTFRTTGGIAAKARLPLDFVDGVLRQLTQADDDQPYRVWQGQRLGREVFTLVS